MLALDGDSEEESDEEGGVEADMQLVKLRYSVAPIPFPFVFCRWLFTKNGLPPKGSLFSVSTLFPFCLGGCPGCPTKTGLPLRRVPFFSVTEQLRKLTGAIAKKIDKLHN